MQMDESDLMPYPLLDAIRDKQMPCEVFDHVSVPFPEHISNQLLEWVERFVRL